MDAESKTPNGDSVKGPRGLSVTCGLKAYASGHDEGPGVMTGALPSAPPSAVPDSSDWKEA